MSSNDLFPFCPVYDFRNSPFLFIRWEHSRLLTFTSKIFSFYLMPFCLAFLTVEILVSTRWQTSLPNSYQILSYLFTDIIWCKKFLFFIEPYFCIFILYLMSCGAFSIYFISNCRLSHDLISRLVIQCSLVIYDSFSMTFFCSASYYICSVSIPSAWDFFENLHYFLL